MKKQLFILLLTLLPMVASAHDVEVKNAQGKTIYYVWTNNNTELAVSFQGSKSYTYSDEYEGDIVIPESVEYNGSTYSVTSIADYAFSDCSGLTSITIGNSVTSIGDYAVYGCTNLTSITIGSNVTTIGVFALFNCSSLTSISIPNSVTNIGSAAFEETGWYSAQPNGVLYLDNCFVGIKGSKPSGALTIQDGTRIICGSAFLSCRNLSTITIPNSVISICGHAFEGCEGLTSIDIPNSVTSIGANAFEFCFGLTSVTIPNSVTSIGDNAFRNCTGLASIEVASGNTTYDSRDNCNAIIETASNTLLVGCINTIIPQSVTSIGASAFNGYDLTSITIPNGVISIGDYAFSRCTGLTSVTIPNSVTSIGSYAFNNCGLTAITIPNSVTSIGGYAFSYCSSLTSITIPNSVTNIGGYAFERTGWYNAQPDGLLYLDNCLVGIKGNKPSGAATIEEGTRIIAGNAFYKCTGLTSVAIPNSVTSIGDYAFAYSTELTSVVIPNSVTTIGEGAFYACDNISSVYSEIAEPFNCKYLFSNDTYLNGTLYIPQGTKVLYTQVDGWKSFLNIEESGAIIPKYQLSFVVNNKVLSSQTLASGEAITPPEKDGEGKTIDWYTYPAKMPAHSLVIYGMVQSLKGDVNGDGEVDIADAVKIVNLVVGKIDALSRPAKEAKDEKEPQ